MGLFEPEVLAGEGYEDGSGCRYPLPVFYMCKGLLIDPEMHTYRVNKVISTATKSDAPHMMELAGLSQRLRDGAEAYSARYNEALKSDVRSAVHPK